MKEGLLRGRSAGERECREFGAGEGDGGLSYSAARVLLEPAGFQNRPSVEVSRDFHGFLDSGSGCG